MSIFFYFYSFFLTVYIFCLSFFNAFLSDFMSVSPLAEWEWQEKKKQQQQKSKVLLSTFVVAGHTWCISGSRARNFASSVCCRHRQTTFTSGTSFGHLSQSSPKYDFKPYFEMEPISKWLSIFLVNDFYLKLKKTLQLWPW